jgi:hypothetical protein
VLPDGLGAPNAGDDALADQVALQLRDRGD